MSIPVGGALRSGDCFAPPFVAAPGLGEYCLNESVLRTVYSKQARRTGFLDGPATAAVIADPTVAGVLPGGGLCLSANSFNYSGSVARTKTFVAAD